MNRKYKISQEYFHRGVKMCEIKEYPDGEPASAILAVPAVDALDVVEALNRAYRNGREDAESTIAAQSGKPNGASERGNT